MSTNDFSNFTPRAQQVLALARGEADRLNHNFLGTEHVLLGILKLGQGTAYAVLGKLSVNLETLPAYIEKQVGTGPDQKMVGNIPYTPRVKKVVALAQKEAKQLHHSWVGTEHLLLGLMREGDGVAAKVLLSLDLGLEQMRQAVLQEVDPRRSRTPTDMGHFTPRASQVMVLARKEAERFNHHFVGTEHILLGLIALGQGVAVNVLGKLGLNLENVRQEVESGIGTGANRIKTGNTPPYTPRVEKMLASADEEMRRLDHTYLGTEHLLLGLLHEHESVAAGIMRDRGIDLAEVRVEILRELDPNYSAGEPASEAGPEPQPETEVDQHLENLKKWLTEHLKPVDVGKRYDVYCIQHGEAMVYRNVLFKAVRALLPTREVDSRSAFFELEHADGKSIFLPRHSVYKFCDPGADASGEKIPAKP